MDHDTTTTRETRDAKVKHVYELSSQYFYTIYATSKTTRDETDSTLAPTALV